MFIIINVHVGLFLLVLIEKVFTYKKFGVAPHAPNLKTGLFSYPLSMHHCVSQNKDELYKYDWFWQIAMNLRCKTQIK